MEFRPHHVAISVRDLLATTEFYRLFGFEPVFRMDDVDLSIAHLARPDGLLLEVFRYAANADVGGLGGRRRATTWSEVGVKHVAFDVDDVHAVRSELDPPCHAVTEIRHGRGGFDFCFVADPDGMWVEILQDDRNLGR